MKLADALRAHGLDVVGLELESPIQQYRNLSNWLDKVQDPTEKRMAAKLKIKFARRYGVKP